MRIVVAIDPAVSSGEAADETGIVVAGRSADGHGYVLADASGRYAPLEWARAAVTAYRTNRADRIVAEVNNGGEMVAATLQVADPDVPFAAVHAARGKVARAEPILARTQRILLVVDLDDRHVDALGATVRLMIRGARPPRDAGGERRYWRRNYPREPTAGKRHEPVCNAWRTAPAWSR